jgi:hypothetical protein
VGELCTSQAVESELVHLCQLLRILPVVLNDVDVVGRREQASKRRRLGIP